MTGLIGHAASSGRWGSFTTLSVMTLAVALVQGVAGRDRIFGGLRIAGGGGTALVGVAFLTGELGMIRELVQP